MLLPGRRAASAVDFLRAKIHLLSNDPLRRKLTEPRVQLLSYGRDTQRKELVPGSTLRVGRYGFIVKDVSRGGRKDARIALYYDRVPSLLGLKTLLPDAFQRAFRFRRSATGWSPKRPPGQPMAAPILVAGLDSRSLLLEAPVLLRDRAVLEEKASARELLDEPRPGDQPSRDPGDEPAGRRSPGGHPADPLPPCHAPRLDPGARARGRAGRRSRQDPRTTGANAVLRRPLDRAQLEDWIAKLLAVPRRVDARVPVQRPGGGHAAHGGDRPLLRALPEPERERHAAREPGAPHGRAGPRPGAAAPGQGARACAPSGAWCATRGRWAGPTSATVSSSCSSLRRASSPSSSPWRARW